MQVKAFILHISTFLPFIAFGQEFVTISGKIVDLETKLPLAFSTVHIQNTPKGVVTNEDGAFDFTFSKEHLSDTIKFSMTGYQSEKMLVQSLATEHTNVIELVAKEVVLAEVVVTNKELTAWDILELAKNSIKKNYPTDPFEFEAFYRDYKIENDECVGIFEAACSVYDKGYANVTNKNALKEKVVLKQVRKSHAVKFQTTSFKRLNVLKELLGLNDVRYQSRALNKKGLKRYEYEIDGYEIINDRLMYKINAVADWTFHIYVDVVTYAIPRIEMNYQWIKDIAENEWTLGDTIRYRQTNAKEILEFQMLNDRYYPKYHSFRFSSEAFDLGDDSLLFTSELLQECLVTDINLSPEDRPRREERMDPYLMIEQQGYQYDPAFWENYNIIKLHPRDKRLIQGLEERIKKEEQIANGN